MKLKSLLVAVTLALASASVLAQTAEYISHTVTKGQGLYSISRMYGVSEQEIIQLNPGSEKMIREGQQLRIPQKQKQQGERKFHTVKAGETLYSLSKMYGTTVSAICAANPGLEVSTFKAGDVIVIPGASDNNAGQSQDTDPAQENASQQQNPADEPQAGQPAELHAVRTHLVQKRETVYKICTMYGITQEDFLQANPEYRYSRLRKGDLVVIPGPDSKKNGKNQVDTQNVPDSQNSQALNVPEDSEAKLPWNLAGLLSGQDKDNFDGVRAALIMPFNLQDTLFDTEKKKSVEFYEGTLIALDKLKNEGISVDLHVYDSGNENSPITDILEKPEMKQMDIIFGPRYDTQVHEAAEFAKSCQIPMVLPVNSSVDEVYSNPYLYQVNTPQSYLFSEVYEKFLKEFPHAKLIIIDCGEFAKNPFLDGFKPYLQEHGREYLTIDADTSVTKFEEVLDPECQNIFLLNSSSQGALKNMIPILQLVTRKKNPAIETHLFGYPEYQAYTADHLDEFYEVDTWFYTWFYTNSILPEAKEFQNEFHRSFSRQMLPTYPSYAAYGYDMTYYFIKGVAKYGEKLSENLDLIKTKPVQMGFRFERASNWGGFINHKVFFVHLTDTYRVEKIDFD